MTHLGEHREALTLLSKPIFAIKMSHSGVTFPAALPPMFLTAPRVNASGAFHARRKLAEMRGCGRAAAGRHMWIFVWEFLRERVLGQHLSPAHPWGA